MNASAIVGEQRVRPVALVDVEVDDEHAQPGTAVGAQRPQRGDDVVEDAEAAAGVGEGVVRAAAEVRAAPSSSAAAAAWIVAPVERRARSTSSGDHGSPSASDSRRVSPPPSTRSS